MKDASKTKSTKKDEDAFTGGLVLSREYEFTASLSADDKADGWTPVKLSYCELEYDGDEKGGIITATDDDGNTVELDCTLELIDDSRPAEFNV